MLETNRELGRKLREKDAQMARLRNNNKELRRSNNKREGTANDDSYNNIDQLKTRLLSRENQVEVRSINIQSLNEIGQVLIDLLI